MDGQTLERLREAVTGREKFWAGIEPSKDDVKDNVNYPFITVMTKSVAQTLNQFVELGILDDSDNVEASNNELNVTLKLKHVTSVNIGDFVGVRHFLTFEDTTSEPGSI